MLGLGFLVFGKTKKRKGNERKYPYIFGKQSVGSL